MERFKNRRLEKGQKVKVYVNLHRKGWFSIVDMESQLVVAHAPSVLLDDAERFFVSDKGREAVRQNRQKGVHAWVVGKFEAASIPHPASLRQRVTYNPYHYESFVTAEDKQPVQAAEKAFLTNKEVYI